MQIFHDYFAHNRAIILPQCYLRYWQIKEYVAYDSNKNWLFSHDKTMARAVFMEHAAVRQWFGTTWWNHGMDMISILLSPFRDPPIASWIPDSKVHGVNMGPRWGRQDPVGPHVGPLNFCYLGCFHNVRSLNKLFKNSQVAWNFKCHDGRMILR